MSQYQVLIMSVSPDFDGKMKAHHLGFPEGEFNDIVAKVRAALESPETRDGRNKEVKVLWYDARLANDPLSDPPKAGTIFSSLRELALAVNAKYSSLTQILIAARHCGFAGAVHRGMAYAFVGQVTARAGDLPARREDQHGRVEIIFAKDVLSHSVANPTPSGGFLHPVVGHPAVKAPFDEVKHRANIDRANADLKVD